MAIQITWTACASGESGGQNLQKQKGSKKINGGATHSYLKENPQLSAYSAVLEHYILWPQETLVLEEKEIAAEALDKEVTQREHVL